VTALASRAATLAISRGVPAPFDDARSSETAPSLMPGIFHQSV
jgi:hypothetical protein